MDSQALSRLDIQISSVKKRIEVFGRRKEVMSSNMAKLVLDSLCRTKDVVAQGLDLRVEAFMSGSILTASKVPGCEPILRRGDKSIPVSGHYVEQMFNDAGGKFFDYQLIHLVPELAADVIDESHAMLLSQEELLQRDLKTLRRARRETTWPMDTSIPFPVAADSSQEAAA